MACGVVLLAAGSGLGFPDITRIGVLLVVLPLLARLLLSRRDPVLAVERTVLPRRLRPDERARVELDLVNLDRRPSPVYLAEEQVDPLLGDRPRFVLPRMDPGARRRVEYDICSPVRGRHRLGPIALQQMDPFGLTHVDLLVRAEDEVLVLPPVVALDPTSRGGSATGPDARVLQALALHGEEDVSIRSYRDGDDLRKVHWPATAHRGRLMVRQEEHPDRRAATLVLDSRTAAHPGSGVRPSFEWAVSALASVALHLHARGHAVHLLTRETVLAGRENAELGPDEILEALARAEPGDEPDHARVVHRAREVARHSTRVVLATTGHGGVGSVPVELHRPGLRAEAFVIDPPALDRGDDPPGEQTRACIAALAGSGWRTVAVGGRTEVAQAWAALTQDTGQVR